MNKQVRHRNQNLNDSIILQIVEILDGWSADKLTWESLIERIDATLRKRYTRQALHNHARIKDAFTYRKAFLRDNSDTPQKSASPEQERIYKLESEIARLKMENNNLLEQFHRWVYNGNLNALSGQMRDLMNSPLPKIYREPSELD